MNPLIKVDRFQESIRYISIYPSRRCNLGRDKLVHTQDDITIFTCRNAEMLVKFATLSLQHRSFYIYVKESDKNPCRICKVFLGGSMIALTRMNQFFKTSLSGL